MKPLWPHQERAVADLPDRLEPGSRGCVTSPTGSGKSRVMRELIRKFGSVSLYTNRRMLLEQLSEDLRQDGIDHGVLARGYAPEWDCDVQLCSVQTITSRAIKKTKWDVPDSRLVLIDECVAGDTWIITENGPTRIEDAKDCQWIQTQDGNEVVMRRILGWVQRSERPVVAVTTENGRSIRCTPEHLVKTQRGWVCAGHLRVGDAVGTARLLPSTASGLTNCSATLRCVAVGVASGSSRTYPRAWSTSCERVVSIETSAPEPVYDVEVEGTHCFYANGMLVHNCHVNKEASVQKIVDRHIDKGAAVLGFTATPLDIGHMYDWLYTMAVTSECRAVGALVPAIHYAPDEPDTRNLKRTKTGEFTEPDVRKAIMSATILGRVIDHYWRINADQRPTVLFAPGVAESLWFCDELNKNGIPAAHIDGERVSLDGQHYVSNKNARDEIRERLRSGDIKVVCNRYVLREGIDWPFVGHMIFATIFGSLCSYLQSGGRGLRASPGKENVTVQDHGGSWHRLGSLNADRDWVLGDTAYMLAELREQRMKQKEEAEPITCAKCHAVRMMGKGCPVCGHISDGKRRMVVQRDGTLKAQHGDIYRMPVRDRSPREVCEQRWESCYHSCRRKGETFREAYGRYHYRYGWVAPPEGLPLMPRNERDWFMRIQDVPMERLIPKADRLFVGGGA